MEKNKMAVMPMTKLVVNMSLPLMLSLLIQSLYNIVDSIFVAKLSEDALTATSLAYPMQLLMIAVGVGTSVGINAMLSRSVGAGDSEKTGRVATTGIVLALIATVVFMLLGICVTGIFVRAFTDDPVIGAYCEQYLFICLVFSGGSLLATMFQRFLQAVGNTFDSMLSLVAGAVTNLILDPVLIFGLAFFPALGIRGAAVATVIGQWVSALTAILLNRFKNPQVKPVLKGYRLDGEILKEIYKVGLPTIITQAMGSIMVTSLNAILIPFSTTAVAFFGVYYKLQSFLFMPMNGLGQAAIPIVGFNYGAKNLGRVREALRTILPIAVGIALVMTAIFLIFPKQLLQMFSASEDMLEMGVPALRIICVTFALSSVSMLLGYAVSGLGVGIVNMIATILRQFVLFVPLAYLLAKYLGISYVWFSIWVAEVLALVYAFWHSRQIFRKKGVWQ